MRTGWMWGKWQRCLGQGRFCPAGNSDTKFSWRTLLLSSCWLQREHCSLPASGIWVSWWLRQHSINVEEMGWNVKWKKKSSLRAVTTFSLCFILSNIFSISLPICYSEKNLFMFSGPDVVWVYVQDSSTQWSCFLCHVTCWCLFQLHTGSFNFLLPNFFGSL